MRIFSDFRIFEQPPRPSKALLRWIAWRWVSFAILFFCFITIFAVAHFVGGEPVYYTNEQRNLSDAEVWDLVWLFAFGGSFFFILGSLGVLFIPKD